MPQSTYRQLPCVHHGPTSIYTKYLIKYLLRHKTNKTGAIIQTAPKLRHLKHKLRQNHLVINF